MENIPESLINHLTYYFVASNENQSVRGAGSTNKGYKQPQSCAALYESFSNESTRPTRHAFQDSLNTLVTANVLKLVRRDAYLPNIDHACFVSARERWVKQQQQQQQELKERKLPLNNNKRKKQKKPPIIERSSDRTAVAFKQSLKDHIRIYRAGHTIKLRVSPGNTAGGASASARGAGRVGKVRSKNNHVKSGSSRRGRKNTSTNTNTNTSSSISINSSNTDERTTTERKVLQPKSVPVVR